MLISKQHLNVGVTAGTDGYRPLLQYIQVLQLDDEVVAVATDGYILSEVREATPSSADFPDEHGAVKDLRISANTAKEAKRVLRPNKLLPVLSFAKATSAGLVVTDLDRKTILDDTRPEGDYPEYSKLIPASDQRVARVTINPKFLAKVLRVFAGTDSVQLEMHGPLKPLVIRSKTAERTITGVVMPLKD
ncbi:MAG: hypothetical protein WA991_03835 [Ornithinimicrobium sp.]